VHGAALPRRAENPGQRGLQAGMRVADRQLDADQAARDERPEELAPERLGLCLADVEATDLAPAGLVNGAVGRGQRGGLPAACGQAQRGVLQLAALAARSPPRSS